MPRRQATEYQGIMVEEVLRAIFAQVNFPHWLVLTPVLCSCCFCLQLPRCRWKSPYRSDYISCFSSCIKIRCPLHCPVMDNSRYFFRRKKLKGEQLEMIVINDLLTSGSGFGFDTNTVSIIGWSGKRSKSDPAENTSCRSSHDSHQWFLKKSRIPDPLIEYFLPNQISSVT